MKNWLDSLFSCDASSVSAMRVMSMLSLFFGMIIAIIGLYRNADLNGLSLLVGIFITSAFGGKAIQKRFEKPNPSDEK
jgi:uncharacterized membrane protein YiaA